MSLEKTQQALTAGNQAMAQALDLFKHAIHHFQAAGAFSQQIPAGVVGTTLEAVDPATHAPAPVPGPVAVHAPMPTAAVEYRGLEPATPSGPTPIEAVDNAKSAVEHASRVAQERFVSLMKLLRGPESVFATFLSPDVVPGGRGSIKPGAFGLQRYREDISQLAPISQSSWPDGFYTDSNTKQLQFFFKARGAGWLLTDLSSLDTRVEIIELPATAATVRRQLGQFNLGELNFLHADLTESLQHLTSQPTA